jgi:hypothetical protein
MRRRRKKEEKKKKHLIWQGLRERNSPKCLQVLTPERNESVLFRSALPDFRRKFPGFARFSFCIKIKSITQMCWNVTEIYLIAFKILTENNDKDQ